MIRLDYQGADTLTLRADAPVGRYLLRYFREHAGHYPCLFLPSEDGLCHFQIHIQYAATFMALLRTDEVERRNRRSPTPTRTMTAELREELLHWEGRRAHILEAAQALDPSPEWRPLGDLEVPLLHPLRPYQRAAVAWMVFSENGLLADDVGLGKTVMAIAYALSMFQAGLATRVLLLCPKAVLLQWVREGIEKFAPAPWNTVQVVDGMGWKARVPQWRSEATWTLTNYEKVREDTRLLGDCSWDILLLDEAQHIRGRKTQVSRAVKELRKRYCFLLTATAIDTVLEDLFSLYQCLHPCILGNETAFRKTYILQRDYRRLGYYIDRIREELPEKIAFTKLRRTKAQVLPQLPPLQETNVPVRMEPDQERLYRSMEEETEESVRLLEDQGGRGSADYMPIIVKLLRLQQIVNAPEHFDPSLRSPSGKIVALEEILEMGHRGKVLIFTFYKVMADILFRTLTEWQRDGRSTLEEILWITGDKDDPEEREKVRDAFNHSTRRVCLVSTDCMKAGVNMAAAEIVVNYDLSYSPATMTQRVGRAHRLGMENVERLGVPDHVLAMNLITENSIETRIPEVLAMRRQLSNSALAESDGQLLRRFTPHELRFLIGTPLVERNP